MNFNTQGIKALGIAAFTLMTTGAQASLTSLINYPIADFLAHREYQENVTAGGTENYLDPKVNWSQGGTLGLFDKGEIGFTNDFESGWGYEAKVKLFESAGDHKFLVSGGFANVSTTDNTVDKFIMARYDAGKVRVHAGYYYSDFGVGVFGVDFGLPHGMSGAIEHATGPGATTWFALNMPVFTEKLQLMLGAGVPWEHGDGYKYTAALTYGMRF